MLAKDVFPFLFLPLSGFFFLLSCIFLLPLLTPFLCYPPFHVFVQYLWQLWRPRLTSLQAEELQDEEEEWGKRRFLSGWSSQRTASPTWTDCFSRSFSGTQMEGRACMTTHTYSTAARGCATPLIIIPDNMTVLYKIMICFSKRR